MLLFAAYSDFRTILERLYAGESEMVMWCRSVGGGRFWGG